MKYFAISVILLLFSLVIAPFCLFPDKMDGYGSYLTGLAAIGAALKFLMPYLLMLFYKKQYSNELIWKSFLETECPEVEGSTLETEWIAGVVNYFRRCNETLYKENPWYLKLPYLADDIYANFGGKHLVGKSEDKLFEEVKETLFKCSEIVAMNSTPDQPITKEDKYKELHSQFSFLVQKIDQLNKLLVNVPVPVKKIIEGDDFLKSFFK